MHRLTELRLDLTWFPRLGLRPGGPFSSLASFTVRLQGYKTARTPQNRSTTLIVFRRDETRMFTCPLLPLIVLLPCSLLTSPFSSPSGRLFSEGTRNKNSDSARDCRTFYSPRPVSTTRTPNLTKPLQNTGESHSPARFAPVFNTFFRAEKRGSKGGRPTLLAHSGGPSLRPCPTWPQAPSPRAHFRPAEGSCWPSAAPTWPSKAKSRLD